MVISWQIVLIVGFVKIDDLNNLRMSVAESLPCTPEGATGMASDAIPPKHNWLDYFCVEVLFFVLLNS